MQRITLNDSVIHHPKTDCTYLLKNNDGDTHETIVTFNGSSVKYCESFDAAAGLWTWSNLSRMVFIPKNQCFISLPSLSSNPKQIEKLPLVMYDSSIKQFGLTLNLTIVAEWKGVAPKYKYACRISGNPPVNLENDRLQNECQSLIPTIKVECGNYPIVLDKVNLDDKSLHYIYHCFLKFNTNQKLSYQYQQTKDLCHARAHFVTEFLYLHGIASMKVFKLWNHRDWQPYTNDKSWGFHCGVMLEDNNKKKWVWDPWVGFNQHLLSLNEWLIRDDEPTPIKLLITNRSVTNPLSKGNSVFGTRITQLPKNEFRAVQAMFADAIPNPPERCIAVNSKPALSVSKNKLSLFSHEEAAIVEAIVASESNTISKDALLLPK